MKKYILLIVIILLTGAFFYYQNNTLVSTDYLLKTNKITETIKIVQLSDLHGKSFGNDQQKLVERISEVKPNIIVFTGDLIDSRKYDETNSLLLMELLVQIAPVYFVTGNHEWRSGQFDFLEAKLLELGVSVLRNTVESITIDGSQVLIAGIDDPAKPYNSKEDPFGTVLEKLANETQDDSLNILLSHRPELFSQYANYNFDIVFSGHAHGGQFRFPLIGGIVAPQQGFFPKYDSGVYTLDQTTMIVNRGLGNSLIPLRLFNQPEVVIVTVEKDQ